MLRALAFGLGVGAAVQAWRNWPATSLVTADSLALVFCVGLVAAFFGGRWSGRGRGATATATAKATAVAGAQANNSVQVALIVPGHGAGSQPGVVRVPSEAAEWFADPSTRLELSIDQLEGMDLSELLEEREREHES